VSFAAVSLCVASQRAFVVVVYFVVDSVRKLLDTPSYKVPECYSVLDRFVFISGYKLLINTA